MIDRAWFFVTVTLLCTVAGQLLLKHAIDRRGAIPSGSAGVAYLSRALLDPLVIVSLALAFVAALAWMAALSRLGLAQAYPFMSLAFVLTTLFGALIIGESVSAARWAGILLVAFGLVMVARG